MGIKKFISIQNVGRLADCKQKGPELKRYNIFFAENGRGKTTLCAVLRSLQNGTPEYITERHTVPPSTSVPTAEIRLAAGSARFARNAWSQLVPEIAIFDATFVAKNVYAGEHIDRDHRSNLLEVIIGEDGITLARAVEALDGAIRAKNAEISQAKKLIEAKIPRTAPVDAFVGLTEEADIAAKLAQAKADHSAASAASEIKKKALLTDVNIPQLSDTFIQVLESTLPDVSAQADAIIRAQINAHQMHEEGSEWLRTGVTYIENDSCPFCGRGELSSLELVTAYGQVFSENYKNMITSIADLGAGIEKDFGAATWATIERDIAANTAASAFWSDFIDLALPTPDLAAIIRSTDYLREVTLALVQQKMSNPIQSVATNAEYRVAVKNYIEAAQSLTNYKAAVAAANALIEAKKIATEAANLMELLQAVKSLELIELRGNIDVKSLCDSYNALKAEKVELDRQKAEAKAELDVYSDSMIANYEASINNLLDGFGAGFNIAGSKKTYVGGTPTSTYHILINGHPIELGDSNTPVGTPSFRTALSAGDKSTLALAFFLAQLDHDSQKASRVVIFDDPFNSQDRSRRERTAELLKKYGTDCSQLLLLSHDPHFLKLVYEKLPAAESHCLQLSRTPHNTTTIEEWNVVAETRASYLKDHAAMKEYLLNGSTDLKTVVRRIRPVMEGYLKSRFPNRFADNHWFGEMIGIIRTEGNDHPMFGAVDELGAINDYSKKHHHESNPTGYETEPVNDGELQSFVKRTLAIAGGY